MKPIKLLVEVMGWLRVFLSPVIIGGIITFVAYGYTQNIVVAIVGCLLSLVAGVWVAERIRKKHGTINFMSRTMATPELDKEEPTKN